MISSLFLCVKRREGESYGVEIKNFYAARVTILRESWRSSAMQQKPEASIRLYSSLLLCLLLSFIDFPHSFLFSSPSLSFKPFPVDEPPPPTSDHPFPKLMIALDLDETLVCAYETSCCPEAVRSHVIDDWLKYFELDCLSVEKDAKGKPKVNYVTVFERLGLREFLQKISKFADLVLFTAGLEDVSPFPA